MFFLFIVVIKLKCDLNILGGIYVKNIIEISNLNKSYGEIKAVSELSFCVKEGELFAFLGVNGAGKSTTINIMCGQLEKDSGTVIVDGVNLDLNRDLVKKESGVVFQNSYLDQGLSVYDNLKNRASLYGIHGNEFRERLNEVTNLFKLRDLLKRDVKKLSGGQKRKVDIARALIHDPKILILDEPTTGLDPQTRKMLWNVIDELRKERNMTVFLTTHYMEEASDADYVVIIDEGKISAKGTPHELKNIYAKDSITLYNVEESEVKKLGFEYELIKDGVKVYIPNTMVATNLITQNPKLFVDFEISKGKMDDIFLAATGKNLNGGNEE